MRLRTLAVAVVVAVVTAYCAFIVLRWMGILQQRADDEAPIYVKNGSLEIFSGDPSGSAHGKWTQESGGYFHDPLTGKPGKGTHLWVKVTASGGSCATGARFDGPTVLVDYSIANVNVSFNRGGQDNRSRMHTTANFNQKNGWSLVHPDSGFITAVRATGGPNAGSCTFGSSDNPTIVICERQGAKDCQ